MGEQGPDCPLQVHVWDIAPLVTAVDAEDPSQQRVPTASPGYTFGACPPGLG